MKQRISNLVVSGFVMAALLCAWPVKAADAEVEKLKIDCQEALNAFLKKDPTLKPFLEKSAGFAIFPNVGKGGFIVGGAHGRGLVYEKNTLVGTARLTQGSIGAQAGGQSFAELVSFETTGALRSFQSGQFEISAGVSAVAAAEGVAKAAKYQEGIAVFVLPKKGLMVEASIGGQKFSFEPVK